MSISDAISSFEKGHYPFSAYPKRPCASILFPGCSMTSQFPRTTDALVRVCRGMGMGVAYDCCATSVAAQGNDALAGRVMGRIRSRLEALGCTEVVLACPNCYAHMADKLGIRCVSIYEKLLEWREGPQAGRLARLMGEAAGVQTTDASRPRGEAQGERALKPRGALRAEQVAVPRGETASEAVLAGGVPSAPRVVGEAVRLVQAFKPRGVLFTPCPDRARREWESQARMLIDMSGVEALRGVPCCGLKPQIACKGAAAVRALDEQIFAKAAGQTIYTVCASCAGQFARMGYEGGVRHVLSAILGVDEAPDCAHAIPNRARRKFDRNLEPLGACDAR